MVKSKQNRLGFRFWFYFRQGWATYFAFIFSATNTLTVTYYLAIEKYPVLNEVFPSFLIYVLFATAIGIPLLIGIGYAHYKKTPSYTSESHVMAESDPFRLRMIVNSDMNLKLNLKVLKILLKMLEEKDSMDKDYEEIKKLYEELNEFTKQRTLANKDDLPYFFNLDKKD